MTGDFIMVFRPNGVLPSREKVTVRRCTTRKLRVTKTMGTQTETSPTTE